LNSVVDKLEYHWKEIYKSILQIDHQDLGTISLNALKDCSNPAANLSRQDFETVKNLYRTDIAPPTRFNASSFNKFRLAPQVQSEPIIDYNLLSIDVLGDKEKHDHFAKVMRK
jgi:hypothetical protein